VAERVIALRQQQPTWGKQRLAAERAKAQGWVPLVSPNTVKRILRDAGLWPTPAPTASAQRGGRPARAAQPRSPDKPSM
jgi:hypothetical protein